MDTTKLKCEKCEFEFERESKFIKCHHEEPEIVGFKWKVKYCDKCYTERINEGRKLLPDILKKMAE